MRHNGIKYNNTIEQMCLLEDAIQADLSLYMYFSPATTGGEKHYGKVR